MKKEAGFKWKLGMFVTVGLLLFMIAIYVIGKQQNLFGSTFQLQTIFKSVSGLKEGNNVRFSGINVGTIDKIALISDTSVKVDMIIQKDVQRFIKKDAITTIGSEGLMGDKVLVIGTGTAQSKQVNEDDVLISAAPVETEQIMASIKDAAENAKIITGELAQFAFKMNNGNGALSRLIGDATFADNLKNTMGNLETSSANFAKFTVKMNDGKGALSKMVSDEKFAKTLDSTMTNLQTGTKGLSENMEAAKSNILLRGYFKKKKRAEAKKQKQLQEQNEQLREQQGNKTDSTSMQKDSILTGSK